MLRSAASVAVGVLVLAARVAGAGESYDDREVMKRALELAQSVDRAIPGPTQCDSRAEAFKKDPIKGQLAELESIEKALRSASRRGSPDEIRRLRASIAGKTGAYTQAVAAYGASAVSFASLDRQLKEHEKTKPKC